MAVYEASSSAMETSDSSTRLLARENGRPSLLVRLSVFSVCCMAIVAQYLYFTLPLSFLTNEVVIARGMSSLTAGMVFGSLCISIFVTLISAPKTSSLITIRKAIVIGLCMSLLSTVFYLMSMGNLAWTIYTIIARVLQGIAIGITDVRYLDMMSWCFPDKISLVTSAYEIAYSLSCMLGSELGGYLYAKYGYTLAMNVTTMLVVICYLAVLLSTYWSDVNEPLATEETPSLKKMCFLPILIFAIFVMCSISISQTILESLFANYMYGVYNIGEAKSGWILMIAALFYTIATFISGFIGTKKQNLKHLLIIGFILMVISVSLLGKDIYPVKQLGLYYPAVLLSVCLTGSGLAQVATLPLMVEHYSRRMGIALHKASGPMGGVYSSFYYLGSFVGPILGGAILQATGSFSNCCTVGGITLFLSLLVIVFVHIKTGTLLTPWKGTECHENTSIGNVASRTL